MFDISKYEAHYREAEAGFIQYLDETSLRKVVSARVSDSGISTSIHDYGHRWSGDYSSRFFYRLFLLEKWYRWQDIPVSFLTVTTVQDRPIEDQIILLKQGFSMILKEMRRKGLSCSYLAAMDFHKTGYGHYHVIFFHEVPYWFQSWIMQKWAVDGYGSKRKGLNFRKRKNEKIVRIVLYLFKHAGKIFSGKSRSGWLRFHSVVWKMQHSRDEDSDFFYRYPGVRLFSMSKDIQKIMRIPEIEGRCLLVKDGQFTRYRDEDFSEDEKKDLDEYLAWFEKLRI